MAQWIAHWTSNPEVAGSNPVKSVSVFIIFLKFTLRTTTQPNHIITFRDGVVGNISACHADARGSIPRRGGFMQLRSIRRHFGRVVKAAAC